jgi:hypothetical protein
MSDLLTVADGRAERLAGGLRPGVQSAKIG